MADKPATGAPGDDGQQDQALSDRVDQLEAGQQTLGDKLDLIIGKLGGGQGDGAPAAAAGEPGGDPATIAHEINAQLAERDRKAAAKAADAERDGTLADLKAKVAELTETKPQPMPRRVEKLMGWH